MHNNVKREILTVGFSKTHIVFCILGQLYSGTPGGDWPHSRSKMCGRGRLAREAGSKFTSRGRAARDHTGPAYPEEEESSSWTEEHF